ncbi:succinylglutamate desuccinylase/aspartoacylase domain-containing protein [Roseospira visakhapatnamensis]|uniref:Putative deacylase n=1 Tax=Roseospira visakhapatnamensis TaxID=390880 RepID=A0A7W6RDA0_9PROT|nr:succinylglutamate desuccinylase/aspartoacylase family protein [Roseospira visakhapatnamensis]MBB4266454.1 putative deacylase [Roseospira visakhapatnamensis]
MSSLVVQDDPVDLVPPDIEGYRDGNTGVPWVYSFDSGHDGPHVMVSAIVHGNELCGAITLDALLRDQVRPVAGRLTLVFANVAAYRRFDAARPTASRFVDEDLNRVWAPAVLDGPRASAELVRARALRPLVDTVDLLLDLHSMQHRTPPLVLAGPLPKGRALARRVGAPAVVVADAGHAAGTRLRDYGSFGRASRDVGAFGRPSRDRAALLVECGQHGHLASVAVAREVTWRFLLAAGVVDPALARSHLPAAPPPPQRVIEVTEAVTIGAEGFTFAGPFVGLEVLGPAGTLVGHDGDRPVVTPYDDCVLVMPSRRLVRGQTAVRLGRFIDPDTSRPIERSGP